MGPPIPLYEPIDDGTKDNVFISKSYDATSHFESTTGMFFFVFPVFLAFLSIPLPFPRCFTFLFQIIQNDCICKNNKLITCFSIAFTDDVRDIYRRAEGQELVVEGLREGQTLAQE